MDLTGIMLNEIRQTGKDKYCMVTFTCVSIKQKQTNKNFIQRTHWWLPEATGVG